MEQKVFQNELNLKGCQECPNRNNGGKKESCCCAPSGIWEDTYYDPNHYDYRAYDRMRLKDINIWEPIPIP